MPTQNQKHKEDVMENIISIFLKENTELKKVNDELKEK